MTTIRVVIFSFGCDVPGCDEWSDDYQTPTVESARRAARKDGWSILPNDATCPRHLGHPS